MAAVPNPRRASRWFGAICLSVLLAGCERHYFKAQGALTSDGGELLSWTRPVQGCSADPLDGLPPRNSSTLFTLYWGNPVDREHRRNPPHENQLERLEISRTGTGLSGSLKTTRIEPDTLLDAPVCSTFQATTAPGGAVLDGGRPTVDGTLDLDCHVAGSHVSAHIRFSGCEY